MDQLRNQFPITLDYAAPLKRQQRGRMRWFFLLSMTTMTITALTASALLPYDIVDPDGFLDRPIVAIGWMICAIIAAVLGVWLYFCRSHMQLRVQAAPFETESFLDGPALAMALRYQRFLLPSAMPIAAQLEYRCSSERVCSAASPRDGGSRNRRILSTRRIDLTNEESQ